MKRVLFLLHIPPPVHGSSVVGKAIMDSSLINKAFQCRYVNFLASRAVSDTGRLNLYKIGGLLSTVGKVLAEFTIRKPVLCYLALTTSGPALYRDAVIVLIMRLFGIRRVYHLHHKGVNAELQRVHKKIIFNLIFQKADVILLSEHLYHDVKDFVCADRLHIVPNGIAKLERNKDFRPGSGMINILFLSNLIVSKGILILLQACKLLKEKGYFFTCNFVGAQGDITADEFNGHINALGLEGTVCYLGRKLGEEKYKLFENADVFVFPTFYTNEAFPLVLLEAMQFGLPIVSTPEGGIPDIVLNNKTGFLVPKRDSVSLANKLEILFHDEELRRRMGHAGRKHFEAKFTLQHFENKLCEVLKGLAK